jgi:hypothetical protein
MKLSQISALALAAVLGLSTAAAQAQQPSAPPPMARDGRDLGEMRDHMREHMAAHRAEHIKTLHDALNIRPSQEAAFSAFAAAMKPEDGDEGREHEGMEQGRAALAAMTTPQRLDFMQHKMEERFAHRREAFEGFAAASKSLYAALGPDQQHTLDALGLMLIEKHGEGMGERHGPPDGARP